MMWHCLTYYVDILRNMYSQSLMLAYGPPECQPLRDTIMLADSLCMCFFMLASKPPEYQQLRDNIMLGRAMCRHCSYGHFTRHVLLQLLHVWNGSWVPEAIHICANFKMNPFEMLVKKTPKYQRLRDKITLDDGQTANISTLAFEPPECQQLRDTIMLVDERRIACLQLKKINCDKKQFHGCIWKHEHLSPVACSGGRVQKLDMKTLEYQLSQESIMFVDVQTNVIPVHATLECQLFQDPTLFAEGIGTDHVHRRSESFGVVHIQCCTKHYCHCMSPCVFRCVLNERENRPNSSLGCNHWKGICIT